MSELGKEDLFLGNKHLRGQSPVWLGLASVGVDETTLSMHKLFLIWKKSGKYLEMCLAQVVK